MIEIKTKYTKKIFKEFQRFHMFKAGSMGTSVIFLIVMLLSFLATLILLTMGDEFSHYILRGLPFFVIFLVVVVTILLLPTISANSAFKNSRYLFDTGLSFTFAEEYFTIINTGDSVNGTSEIKYTALFKAYETKNYFFLYLQKNQAYIVDKNDFVRGTPEGLSALLKRTLPSKKFRKYAK